MSVCDLMRVLWPRKKVRMGESVVEEEAMRHSYLYCYLRGKSGDFDRLEMCDRKRVCKNCIYCGHHEVETKKN